MNDDDVFRQIEADHRAEMERIEREFRAATAPPAIPTIDDYTKALKELHRLDVVQVKNGKVGVPVKPRLEYFNPPHTPPSVPLTRQQVIAAKHIQAAEFGVQFYKAGNWTLIDWRFASLTLAERAAEQLAHRQNLKMRVVARYYDPKADEYCWVPTEK